MRERVPHDELLSCAGPRRSRRSSSPRRRAPGSTTTGYWAVSKHADVAAISKDQRDFSTPDTAIIRFGPDMDRDGVEISGSC